VEDAISQRKSYCLTPIEFTEEQMQWLRMIKDYVANSFHVDKDDFELDPFNKNGGLGRCGNCLARRRMRLMRS